MSVRSALWTLASPYDAYVSHVSRLDAALEQIRYLVTRALAYEATLHGSVRLVPGKSDAAGRSARFRSQLSAAAVELTDDQFEEFIAQLGGGSAGEVETDRARALGRLTAVTEALERHFATAAVELGTLESRDYRPDRGGVARLLRENNLPGRSLAEYRHLLRDLAAQVGQKVA